MIQTVPKRSVQMIRRVDSPEQNRWKVGLSRFELESKRPKRPSIGQANPQALPIPALGLPFLNVTTVEGNSHLSA